MTIALSYLNGFVLTVTFLFVALSLSAASWLVTRLAAA